MKLALGAGFLAALAFAGDGLRAQPAPCDNCGSITSIRPVTERQSWTPLGTVVPGTVVGDGSKLARETGWTPRIPIERTLADLLDWWRARVA